EWICLFPGKETGNDHPVAVPLLKYLNRKLQALFYALFSPFGLRFPVVASGMENESWHRWRWRSYLFDRLRLFNYDLRLYIPDGRLFRNFRLSRLHGSRGDGGRNHRNKTGFGFVKHRYVI